MTTKIYATGDERLIVTGYNSDDRGRLIQLYVYGGLNREVLHDLTLEEAEALCIRLAAYLGGARDTGDRK